MRRMSSTALFLVTATLVACAMTTGMRRIGNGASGQQHDAYDVFERWTDWHVADQNGEGVEYIRAVSAAAQKLENLDDSDLDGRLKALVEPLAEEARWMVFYKTPQGHDCLRTLPWQKVQAQMLRYEVLVSWDLGELNRALAPNASMQLKRETIVLVERELPVIRSLRLELVEGILKDVYEVPTILRGAERFEHLVPLLDD